MSDIAPTTKSQRLHRRMKKDAERQAERRAAMAEQRRPETHAVDRALAEAVAYVAIQHHIEGTKRGEIMIPFRDILEAASRILAHRDRFDEKQAVEAVVARTRGRKAHLWTLDAPKRPQRDDICR